MSPQLKHIAVNPHFFFSHSLVSFLLDSLLLYAQSAQRTKLESLFAAMCVSVLVDFDKHRAKGIVCSATITLKTIIMFT